MHKNNYLILFISLIYSCSSIAAEKSVDDTVKNDGTALSSKTKTLERTMINKQFDIATPQFSDEGFENRLSDSILIRTSPKLYNLEVRQNHYFVPSISLVILEKGQVVVSKGYGTLKNGETTNVDTIYQAGSISKPLAASLALTLASENAIDLNKNIKNLLIDKGFDINEFSKEINLISLFGHTAGFNVSGFSGFPRDAILPTLDDMIRGRPPAKEDAIKLDTEQFGNWSYSGGGYLAAQIAIEDMTHKTYESQAQLKIFDKLKMKKSSFLQPVPNAEIARGNTADGQVLDGWLVYPQPTAAGLWSTASDMALWLQAINKSYSSSEGMWDKTEIKKLWELVSDVGPFKQGLGFRWGGKGKELWISANGDTKGYHARIILFPVTGNGLIMMTNANNEQASPFADELVRAVASEYNWSHFKPQFKTLMTEKQINWHQLVGRYSFNENVSLVIDLNENGKAWMAIERDQIIGKKRFLFASDDGNYFTMSGTELLLDSTDDGKVMTMNFVQNSNKWLLNRQQVKLTN